MKARLPAQSGEVIDRDTPVNFTWNGNPLFGHAGDTIASALMANGVRIVSRSMKYHRPRGYMTNDFWDPNAFVQVGDFIGTGVKHAKRRGIPRTTIFGMMGKLSKMADGVTQTHQAGSRVNMEMLAELAQSLGAVESVLEEIRAAKTARRVLELAVEHGWPQIAALICERVSHVMTNYANGRAKGELTQAPGQTDEAFEIVCCMTDFDGAMLGQYPLAENIRPI
ncbi:MAG: cobalt-precorrin-5B (C(1))-methyltransferase [Actinomycetota bacterium]